MRFQPRPAAATPPTPLRHRLAPSCSEPWHGNPSLRASADYACTPTALVSSAFRLSAGSGPAASADSRAAETLPALQLFPDCAARASNLRPGFPAISASRDAELQPGRPGAALPCLPESPCVLPGNTTSFPRTDPA